MIYLIDKIALSNRLKIYGFDRGAFIHSNVLEMRTHFLSHSM